MTANNDLSTSAEYSLSTAKVEHGCCHAVTIVDGSGGRVAEFFDKEQAARVVALLNADDRRRRRMMEERGGKTVQLVDRLEALRAELAGMRLRAAECDGIPSDDDARKLLANYGDALDFIERQDRARARARADHAAARRELSWIRYPDTMGK